MSVALVSGGGGGIGRAIALALAADGWDVGVADLDAAAGQETARLVEAAGRRALFVATDMSSAAQVAACVAAVEDTLGAIAGFANNAGIEGVVAPLHEYPDEVFDRLMQVNVKGIFLGMKHVLARMLARGEGAIVNTASTSAIRGRAGLAGYVASKHAVLGLTRTAALDVAHTRIRINAVLPGPIETRMIQSLNQQAALAGGIKRSGNRSSNAQYGDAAEVAQVVAFLLSARASHVHGADWVVDGGSTIA